MNTIMLIVIAMLLWFIWRQLATIADALVSLNTIALERQRNHWR